MLVSLPSSGSDWFAGLLEAVNPELRAHTKAKEFFNPICNAKHYEELRRAFGCELVDCYRNIAVPWSLQQESIETAFATTWESEPFTFTKEVYAFRKLGFFVSRFNMIGLIRSARLTFPPTRLRVLSWYQAILRSFARFDEITSDPRFGPALSMAVAEANTLLEQAVAGHTLALAVFLESATGLEIPILDWSLLVSLPPEVLQQYLTERLPAFLRPLEIAGAVARTRYADLPKRERAYAASSVESFRRALIDRLPDECRRHFTDQQVAGCFAKLPQPLAA